MSFLTDQIRDANNKKLVFPEMRRLRLEDILKEKKEHEEGVIMLPGWAGRNRKVYPSSLSFGMCVHAYLRSLEEDPKFKGIEDEKAKYRTEAGKYKHMEIQDLWVRSPKLYTLPRIPQELALELIPKLIKEWPEVPVRCHRSGISGKADLIIRSKDKPVLVDIKTTSKEDKEWDKVTTIPANYRTQLCVYAYLMNFYEYYPDPIETIGIAFYNLKGTLGEREPEREIYIDYDAELKEKTKILIDEIAYQRDCIINKVQSECTSQLCKTHKGGSDE